MIEPGFTYTFRLGWSPLPKPTMAGIVRSVADQYGLTVAELRGPRRFHHFVRPRHEAMWRMAQTGRWSLPQIGNFLGGRDHTTVLHGIRRHAQRMAAAKVAA